MKYVLDFSWLWDSLGALAAGAGVTLLLIACTTVFGLTLSILGAAARRGR